MADLAPDQPTYLHGDLDLLIIAARNLPNMDVLSSSLRRCVTACGACAPSPGPPSGAAGDAGDFGPHHRPKIVTSDAYVTVRVPQATVARTRVLKNSKNPEWNQRFLIPLAHPVTDLEFQVKDDDVFGAEVIGTAKIPVTDIAMGNRISGWFTLTGSSCKPSTAIRLDMKFTSAEENPTYRNGIAGDPEKRGVAHTYFPLRKGSNVTLYQDAHVPDGLLPKIELDGGKVYKHESCWEDICYAISEAHHLIYIVGWSVFHKVRLIRESTRSLPRGGELTLGDLLKYKSEEGVRVLLLVWDDRTSHNKYFISTVRVPLGFSIKWVGTRLGDL